MGKNVFSVPIFIIVFRETLEAAIIVSVLLSLVEQLVTERVTSPVATSIEGTRNSDSDSKDATETRLPTTTTTTLVEDDSIIRRRLLRRMRIQIFLGAAVGLFIALAIGAAFIAVWFTKASNLWEKAENLWEGIFNVVASLMIFVMGVTMLKIDRAKVKWRVKLEKAFDGSNVDKSAKTGKWMLFVLPLVTLLREGIEAVIFVGGVSLGQPATSIPIAAIVGIICGVIVGYLIYQFASRTALTVFLVIMTNFLLLIGAGLFSKGIADFEEYSFNKLLGADSDDAGGTGPGSYRVQGNVWHLDCCSPNDNTDGWTIFNAIFGWNNNASLGTVLSYVLYWIAVIAVLVIMKFKEGRTKIYKYESAISKVRRERKEETAGIHDHEEKQDAPEMGISELPR